MSAAASKQIDWEGRFLGAGLIAFAAVVGTGALALIFTMIVWAVSNADCNINPESRRCQLIEQRDATCERGLWR